MRNMTKLLIGFALTLPMINIALSSGDKGGEPPVFFGKLTSHEGRTFNVTNIKIAQSRGSSSKPALYEMPKIADARGDRIHLNINPYQDLTTTELDLMRVRKIEVPKPQVTWLWKKPSDDEKRPPAMTYEFLELAVTWKNNQTVHYLLELGLENTTKPIKIFSDSTGNQQVQGVRNDQDKAMFCEGIKQVDLRKKGAPFRSIKELEIEGHCYKPPQNNTK